MLPFYGILEHFFCGNDDGVLARDGRVLDATMAVALGELVVEDEEREAHRIQHVLSPIAFRIELRVRVLVREAIGRGGVECRTLLGREPLRVRGFLGEKTEHDEAEEHRGQAFHEIHPLPAVQAQVPVEA